MSGDNIKVAIRVRRLIERELLSGLKSHWNVNENSICCMENDSNGRKIPPYSFDRVFDDSTVTLDIFEEVCKPIVDSALGGFNGTLFAYGQSSSGKTFTMSGSRIQPGIISLATDEIFSRIQNIPDREFLIRIGYLEIYKEKVSDLLTTEDTNLKLQEDTDHNIQVVGITEEVVKDGNSVFEVLKKGNANRHTAETKQNDRSSRSHCILRFVIESRKVGHEDDAVMVSNLYFVDLAGSEKAGDNSGDRFKEGCAINKSLFTLGMVIRKLSGDTNQQHVSFRDSKLTRILQNALGGNSKTAIICTITPAHVDESDSTLKFASRAKNITNKPTVNEVMNDAAMLKQYRLKMKKLEQQIRKMNADGICLEKVELEKQLEEKERVEKQQAEMISKLQEMIVISGSSHMAPSEPKRRRRETWCPGKAKMPLHAIPEFSPPHLKNLTLPNKMMEPIIDEDEDTLELLENIKVPTSSVSFAPTHNVADETISANPTVKELFELQDKHEILLNELEEKNRILKELDEFTQLERMTEAEQLDELRDELKKKDGENEALKANLPWLEEELMKAQQERNSLRMKVESLNAKLNSVEDGTGITQIAGQLTQSETQVSDLSSDLQVQKSQYEFHIKQLKLKLETYTTMLEEKGVDFETIKTRLSVNDVDESCILPDGQNSDNAALKAKHEEEINELQTEVDMKMIALDKEKQRTENLRIEFEMELEKQKEHYLQDITDAKEEIEIYQQMLEEEKSKRRDTVDTSMSRDSSVSEDKIREIQDKYEEEITRLNQEIQKYQSQYDELKETCRTIGEDNKQNTDSPSNTDDVNEKFVEQIASLEQDVQKYKDLYESVQDRTTSRGSQALDCTVEDETMDINVQLMNGNAQNEMIGGMGMDLQKEMMQAEIEKLRDNHEAEVAELKEEIAKYVLKYKQIESQEGDNEQTEMENLRESHKAEVAELQNEISKYVTMLEQNENKEAMDLQTEMAQVEYEKLKENHETEVAELKKEISKYVTILEQNENKDTMDLQTEMAQAELEKLKENHEIVVADLKKEISTMLEQNGNKESMDLQTEMMQAELEKLKENHETEIVGLNEEISKYVTMLEQTANKEAMDLQTEMMQAELEKLKENHEAEVAELKTEISKYVTMLEQNKNKETVDLQTEMMQAEMEKLKENYKTEIAEMKTEISKYVTMLGQNENKEAMDLQTEMMQAEIEKLKENHETEVAQLREEINNYVSILEQNGNKAEGDLQTEMMQAEMIKMKESHENYVAELKEEMAKYVTISEQKELNAVNLQQEIVQSDMETLRNDHEREVTELRADIAKYVDKLNEINAERDNNLTETVDDQINNLKQMHEMEVTKLKEEITRYHSMLEKNEGVSEMQTEIVKMKEDHDNVVAGLNQEIAKYEGINRLSECTNEQNENLKVEMNKLRETHENEVAELKQEITKYVEMMKQIESPETDNLQVEMMQSELRSLKENHADEVAKQKEEINTYMCLLDEDTVGLNKTDDKKDDDELNLTEINKLKTQFENERKEMQSQIAALSQQKMDCGDDTDVHMEYKMAMKEADLERCREEIAELKSKLCSSEECTQQEKDKFERILECVDERRLHQDDNHDMKATYEEKITELEDEIKIYMEMLAEEKERNNGQKNDEGVSAEVEHVEAKFVTEINRLKKELEKYSRLSLCGNEQVNEKSIVEPVDDQTVNYQEENQTLKDQISKLQQSHQIELDGMKKQFEAFVEENYETKKSFEDMKKNYEELIETLRIELDEFKNQLLQLQVKHSRGVKTACDVKTADDDVHGTERNGGCGGDDKLSESISMIVQQVDIAKELIDVSMNTSSHRESIEKLDTDDIKQLKQEVQDKEKGWNDLYEAHEDAKKMWNEEKTASSQIIEEQNESMLVLESRNTELEDHMKALEVELKTTFEENSTLKSKVEELVGHITMGKGMLERRDEEIKTLNEYIEEIREEMDKELQEKVEEMKVYVSELENNKEVSEDALKLANEKVDELEQCEAQFSDKIIMLESDLEFLKEKEETLSKMCTDYEEKIVLLEADLDSMKSKTADYEKLSEDLELGQSKHAALKEVCDSYEEKIVLLEADLDLMKTKTADYERLCADLEIAQSKHVDLKEVRDQYNGQIQELAAKLKESEVQTGSLELTNTELTRKLESVSNDLESVNNDLGEMKELYQHIETEKVELETNIESMKSRTADYDKLCVDLERAQSKATELELQYNEQVHNLVTKSKGIEIQKELLESENMTLTAKLESVSNELVLVNGSLSKLTEEHNGVEKEKRELLESENMKLSAKLESVSNELVLANESLSKMKEKHQIVENEKVEFLKTQSELEATRNQLKYLEKELEVMKSERQSLEDDIVVLEKGLPVHVLKYHTKPENVEWEKKWEDFTTAEKAKRVAVGSTIKRLKRELVQAEERQKNAYEEALQSLYEKEQKDLYKELEARMEAKMEARMADINALYPDIDERKNSQTSTEKLNTPKSDKPTVTKSETISEDHVCQFKLEAFVAEERLTEIKEEFKNRIDSYESTIRHYEERIFHMKNQMRLQSNLDNTLEVGSMKMPSFDTVKKEDKTPLSTVSNPVTNESSTSTSMTSNSSNLTSTSTSQMSVSTSQMSSKSGGIVDYLSVLMKEAENKDLKKEIEKQKRKLCRLDILEKENKALKQNLDKVNKPYKLSETEKENIEEELGQPKSVSKVKTSLETSLSNTSLSRSTLDGNTSLATRSQSRHPLEDMFKLCPETPPSPRREAVFKEVFAKSQKREETARPYPEETPKCQTQ